MYYYLYKITNLINNKIYIGKHQTDNLEDGYMGSGVALNRAYRKYGIENFKKDIIEFYDNDFELCLAEKKIVNENFVKRKDVYNIALGGKGDWTHRRGYATVKDKDGNTFQVKVDDPRYLSGELLPVGTRKTPVKDKDGNIIYVDIDDPRYLSGELVHNCKGMVTVKDKNENIFYVNTDDPRFLSGELIHITKGRITVKDKDGNTCQVNNDDPRYLSGELVPFWTGRKHTTETILKMSKKAKQRVGKKCSTYGKHWIHSLTKKRNRIVKKEDLNEYLNNGWIRGRKLFPKALANFRKTLAKNKPRSGKNSLAYGTCWIYNLDLKKSIRIKKEEINKYLFDGWIKGRKLKF